MTAIAELVRIARDVVPPVGASQPIVVVDHQQGGRLPKPLDAYPNGVGGRTRYGVAWLVEGRIRTDPFVRFDQVRDSLALVRILEGRRPASRPAPATGPANDAARAGEAQGRLEAPVADPGASSSWLPALEALVARAEGGNAASSTPPGSSRAAGAMPGHFTSKVVAEREPLPRAAAQLAQETAPAP